MSDEPLPPMPKSPSVGQRRKGPKQLPTLPASAFTPPNTGTGDMFPLAPSPSTLQCEEIIDAHVIARGGDLSKWKSQAGEHLSERIKGVVLSLADSSADEVEKVVKELSTSASAIPIFAIAVPFVLEDGVPASPPSYLASGSASQPTIVLTTVFTKLTPAAIEALTWALTQGFTVNIDVQVDIAQESGWEALEELLTKATESEHKGKIVLSNILPPPDDFALPIVKLLTHPNYRSYQSHTASLSLVSNLFLSFLPPAWGAVTPPTPAPNASAPGLDSKEKKEWKRRIKMYIGPAVEALGFQRIVFGTSPSSSTASSLSNAGDWYELARESFAELGIEQEMLDGLFYHNAKLAYSRSESS